MGAESVLQRLLTLEGDSSSLSAITQPYDSWLDAGDWADASFTLEVNDVTTTGSDTVDISMRTSGRSSRGSLASEGGFASLVWKQLAVDSRSVYKRTVYHDPSNPAPIERFCFWHIDVNGTSGPWTLTFNITAVLKRPA